MKIFLVLSPLLTVVSAAFFGKFKPAENVVLPVCLAAPLNKDGARAILAPCDNSSGNVFWSATGAPFHLSTFSFKQCLDNTDGISTNGNKVQLWSCGELNTNQLWDATPANPFKIIWGRVQSKKCLTISGGVPLVGAELEIRDCDTSRGQLWIQEDIPPVVPPL